MTNEQKCTTLTQSQRLKEIGFEAEADGYYTYGRNMHKDNILDVGLDGTTYKKGEKIGWTNRVANEPIIFPKYRLDTLLLALPEWIVRARQYLYDFNGQMVPKEIEIKLTKIGMSKFITPLRASVIEIGPQAIAAAVDLICLLKEVEE